jgi:hypothetical protein
MVVGEHIEGCVHGLIVRNRVSCPQVPAITPFFQNSIAEFTWLSAAEEGSMWMAAAGKPIKTTTLCCAEGNSDKQYTAAVDGETVTFARGHAPETGNPR